jgi:hypothetical protein
MKKELRQIIGTVKSKYLITDFDAKALENQILDLFELEKVKGKANKKEIRSIQQNRYYHGVVLDIICDYTGIAKPLLHENLRDTLIDDTIGEYGLKRKKSSATLTTKQFEEYTESIRRWAAIFLNVVIPEPNQIEWVDEFTWKLT